MNLKGCVVGFLREVKAAIGPASRGGKIAHAEVAFADVFERECLVRCDAVALHVRLGEQEV